MGKWERRGNFLVEVAQRCLRGQKTFGLCRSHLVEASQISKGTVYNHFTTEADLMVAVACSEYEYWLQQAKQDEIQYKDPLERFIFHHCQRLYEVLSTNKFVIERIMPNQALLLLATEFYRHGCERRFDEYMQWNAKTISAVGEVPGFDRVELVMSYLRGAMINTDDACKAHDDPQLYYQFSYALIHLMGHSDKRSPSKQQFAAWLSRQPSLEYEPEGLRRVVNG
ncbi:TetR family transcriptional regulator [Shewanella chilikensis]|uniref:TetR family transcriptional regulator n=1 Tax=Shewanella chilikensis TaxID=558541 RepID=A0ABX5PLL3_9GAMM|nr:TetR family transcriptional regulator [Shewanella chilikensis]MCL1155006.1 TetR/AcrR family transcriptional regulator [Shewanella chilikensis]PYE57417.1 TetR family transcriptional regulator [Shewanella chilikensis]GGZ34859.1 hypothetical protein GCM10007105_22850 [Shewanella chilikensis]